MTQSQLAIVVDIKNYIAQGGGNYTDWYAGIAANPRDRLFNGHGVDEKHNLWIFRDALTSQAAREVEEYFIYILGAAGDTGGGDNNSKFVYAYKITQNTKE